MMRFNGLMGIVDGSWWMVDGRSRKAGNPCIGNMYESVLKRSSINHPPTTIHEKRMAQ
jgi:hypothetical protein